MAIHHRICHILGGTFGLAHGDVNSVVLPHAARFNQPAAPQALERVAGAMGVEDAPTALFDLATSIGAPISLQALGMEQGDLEQAARLIVDQPGWNPRTVEVADVLALLEDAFHGSRPALRSKLATGGPGG
jgi:alcohol dehydrogenase class IV